MKNIRNSILSMLILLLLIAFGESEAMAKKKKSIKGFDWDLELALFGGYRNNYATYQIKSPVIGGEIGFVGKYGWSESFYNTLSYKIQYDKFLSNVERSDYTLDKLYQKIKIGTDYTQKKYDIGFDLGFNWMLKSNWADQYQPSPSTYTAGQNLNNVKLQATDRYSYYEIVPVLRMAYRIKPKLPIYMKAGYNRHIGSRDPSFVATKPSRLTPGDYSVMFAELGIKSTDYRSFFNFDVAYETGYRWDEVALARDGVTGKTHYTRNPNPTYKEFYNIAKLKGIFYFKGINLKLKPYYEFAIHDDLYSGYYYYTGHTIGLKVYHKIGKSFKYVLKGEGDFRSFGDNSYGTTSTHPALTDGSHLYKYYYRFGVDTDYRLTSNISLFLNGDMVIKKTNFPSYVPGSNPVSTANPKNYDIDFGYENYAFDLGVRYKF